MLLVDSTDVRSLVSARMFDCSLSLRVVLVEGGESIGKQYTAAVPRCRSVGCRGR